MSQIKYLRSILLITIVFLTKTAFSGSITTKVIYGDDNRVDILDLTDSRLVKLASSTAAMISSSNLVDSSGGQKRLLGFELGEKGICEQERFSDQLAPASCSGFLVDTNKIVTAGHCIESQFDCSQNSWVFDFKLDFRGQKTFTFGEHQVYKCKSIVSRKLSGDLNDYALIELDRHVIDREPLAFRKEGRIQSGQSIFVIGHPSGLPTKYADDSSVHTQTDIYFSTNLDTYGGNSGSAVFNADTLEVEGILVRGDVDYISSSQGCLVSNRITSSGVAREDVTKITNIAELQDITRTGSSSEQGSDDEVVQNDEQQEDEVVTSQASATGAGGGCSAQASSGKNKTDWSGVLFEYLGLFSCYLIFRRRKKLEKTA